LFGYFPLKTYTVYVSVYICMSLRWCDQTDKLLVNRIIGETRNCLTNKTRDFLFFIYFLTHLALDCVPMCRQISLRNWWKFTSNFFDLANVCRFVTWARHRCQDSWELKKNVRKKNTFVPKITFRIELRLHYK